MGFTRFSAHDHEIYAMTTNATLKSAGRAAVFKAREIDPEMDPKKAEFRESRDSALNPESTPIIVGLDVTGSMGMIPAQMITEGLGTLFNEVYQYKPVSDPHILFAGIGDAIYDNAPLQIGQFEADNSITKWLEKMWLEGHGGSNTTESYEMLYHFALMHTKTDSFVKRGQKGFIFSIGDEFPVEVVKATEVNKVFGYQPQNDMLFRDLIDRVKQNWVPCHIIISQGSCVQRHGVKSVLGKWRAVMDANVVVLSDYTKLSYLIIAILQIASGKTVEEISVNWDEETIKVVHDALNGNVQ